MSTTAAGAALAEGSSAAGGGAAGGGLFAKGGGAAGGGITASQAFTGAGLFVNALGTLGSVRQAGQLGSYNQSVIAAQRQQAIDAAASAEATRRFQVKRLIGTQAAGYAGSGLSYEGSPLSVISDTARQGELDALRIRYGGTIGAYSADASQGQNTFEVGRTKTSAELNFGQTLLQGGSLLAGRTGPPRVANSY